MTTWPILVDIKGTFKYNRFVKISGKGEQFFPEMYLPQLFKTVNKMLPSNTVIIFDGDNYDKPVTDGKVCPFLEVIHQLGEKYPIIAFKQKKFDKENKLKYPEGWEGLLIKQIVFLDTSPADTTRKLMNLEINFGSLLYPFRITIPNINDYLIQVDNKEVILSDYLNDMIDEGPKPKWNFPVSELKTKIYGPIILQKLTQPFDKSKQEVTFNRPYVDTTSNELTFFKDGVLSEPKVYTSGYNEIKVTMNASPRLFLYTTNGVPTQCQGLGDIDEIMKFEHREWNKTDPLTVPWIAVLDKRTREERAFDASITRNRGGTRKRNPRKRRKTRKLHKN